MINKIKGMVNLREDVDILNTNFMVNKKLIEELADEFRKEIKDLKELKQYQTEFLGEFKNSALTVSNLRKKMEKELDEIRHLKHDMQREMMRIMAAITA